MKRSFRNRLLALAAISVSSIMLLSGFDSSLTVEDVFSKAQEASAGLKEFSADVKGTADVVLDATMSGATTSLPLTGGMDMHIQYSIQPFEFALTGTYTGDASAMGMSGEIGIEMYMVAEEDGTGKMYTKLSGLGEEPVWQAVAIPEDQIAQINDMIGKSLSGDYASVSESTGIDIEALQQQFMGDAQLAPEAVNVNGKDCYEISLQMTGDTIGSMMSQIAEANPEMGMDESTLQIAQMILSMIRFDFVEDLDVETFLPVFASIDLSGSDFSMLGQMVGAMMFSSGSETEETPDVQLTVNALNMTMDYDTETPVSIEVPAEALDAEVTELDMDAVAALGDTAA